jgi:short subunit dehydrogenase-like uncharacterized protein
MHRNWMIYGAYGYTGQLIAHEARARGFTPVLAGRNEGKLAALAHELGFSHRTFALDDPLAVWSGLADMALVLHCAGPFSATAHPMLTACLENGVHYLDITGEIAVFEAAHAQNARAREAGVLLCPGVGFDVVPTDCLAATLAHALPGATHLALGFDSKSGMSRGTARTSEPRRKARRRSSWLSSSSSRRCGYRVHARVALGSRSAAACDQSGFASIPPPPPEGWPRCARCRDR